jgi:hypothetical protein
MSRAPQLAPSWLPRQRRRHIDRALRKLMKRGACSICGSPFAPGSATAGGFDARGNVVLAGECCVSQVAEIFMTGLEFTAGHPVAAHIVDCRAPGRHRSSD